MLYTETKNITQLINVKSRTPGFFSFIFFLWFKLHNYHSWTSRCMALTITRFWSGWEIEWNAKLISTIPSYLLTVCCLNLLFYHELLNGIPQQIIKGKKKKRELYLVCLEEIECWDWTKCRLSKLLFQSTVIAFSSANWRVWPKNPNAARNLYHEQFKQHRELYKKFKLKRLKLCKQSSTHSLKKYNQNIYQ